MRLLPVQIRWRLSSNAHLLGELCLASRRQREIRGRDPSQTPIEGLGIAVVSRIAVADQLRAGRLVTLDVTGLTIKRPFNRLELAGRRPSIAAQAFLELLQPSSAALAR